MQIFLMIFPRMSLNCMIVSVQYREYETGLFPSRLQIVATGLRHSLGLFVTSLCVQRETQKHNMFLLVYSKHIMFSQTTQSHTQSQWSSWSAVVVARLWRNGINMKFFLLAVCVTRMPGSRSDRNTRFLRFKIPFPQSSTWRQLTADRGDRGLLVRDWWMLGKVAVNHNCSFFAEPFIMMYTFQQQ